MMGVLLALAISVSQPEQYEQIDRVVLLTDITEKPKEAWRGNHTTRARTILLCNRNPFAAINWPPEVIRVKRFPDFERRGVYQQAEIIAFHPSENTQMVRRIKTRDLRRITRTRKLDLEAWLEQRGQQ